MNLAHTIRLPRPAPVGGGSDPEEALAAEVFRSISAWIDVDRLHAMGDDLRCMKRDRVHHFGMVCVSLIVSALQRSTDTQGRIRDAQAVYKSLGGPSSGETSFRNYLRRTLPVLHALLQRRTQQLVDNASADEMRGRMAAFRDVLVPDGCAFKIACALAGEYPGTGTAAGLKLHAVYSVNARAASVEFSAGSVHDSSGFWPTTWIRDALYLWDLGFDSYARFIDAANAGAHVVQRLKDNSNPTVLRAYGTDGHARVLAYADGAPMRLNDACESGRLDADELPDVDVLIEKGGRSIVARVVCVPFDGQDRYYLTTLPRALFSPHDIASLYRVRWEVELLFRTWKGGCRLDEVRPLRNNKSLFTMVHASLLAALLTRDVHVALLEVLAREPEDKAVRPLSASPRVERCLPPSSRQPDVEPLVPPFAREQGDDSPIPSPPNDPPESRAIEPRDLDRRQDAPLRLARSPERTLKAIPTPRSDAPPPSAGGRFSP